MKATSAVKPAVEPEPVIGISTKDKIQKDWEEAGISNNFIFCKIMEDEELLTELIRMVAPELDFSKIEIRTENSIEVAIDAHGIRLDVYAKNEEGDVVDIEMQVSDVNCLPKRMRYYESVNDSSMLDRGLLYNELRKSYVVLITLFDHYGKGLHKYTFTNTCEEDPSVKMGDETTKIVLNAVGTADDIDDKMKAFLDYVAGKKTDDEYVKKLDQAVKKAKMNKRLRRDYMTLYQHDLEIEDQALKKGIVCIRHREGC